VACEAPGAAHTLGNRLYEATGALASRCLLSCFVGFLADEPPLALWEDLLQARAYHGRPLMLIWLAALVCWVEGDLATMGRHADADELVPLAFKRIQEAAHGLPAGWRPCLELSKHRFEELRRTSTEASSTYGRKYEEQRQRELHAGGINASLDRAASNFFEAVKSAERL